MKAKIYQVITIKDARQITTMDAAGRTVEEIAAQTGIGADAIGKYLDNSRLNTDMEAPDEEEVVEVKAATKTGKTKTPTKSE